MSVVLLGESECCKNLRGKRDAMGRFEVKNYSPTQMHSVSELFVSLKLSRAERQGRFCPTLPFSLHPHQSSVQGALT